MLQSHQGNAFLSNEMQIRCRWMGCHGLRQFQSDKAPACCQASPQHHGSPWCRGSVQLGKGDGSSGLGGLSWPALARVIHLPPPALGYWSHLKYGGLGWLGSESASVQGTVGTALHSEAGLVGQQEPQARAEAGCRA